MLGDGVGCALLGEGFAHGAALRGRDGCTGPLHARCSFALGDEARPPGRSAPGRPEDGWPHGQPVACALFGAVSCCRSSAPLGAGHQQDAIWCLSILQPGAYLLSISRLWGASPGFLHLSGSLPKLGEKRSSAPAFSLAPGSRSDAVPSWHRRESTHCLPVPTSCL